MGGQELSRCSRAQGSTSASRAQRRAGAALTCSLIPGVQQLHEWSRGPFGINGIGSLLVLGQLAQHAGRHALDVLHR